MRCEELVARLLEVSVVATMGKRPALLFVTAHSPSPPVSGGRRRELELIRRLARLMDVKLCCISKTPDDDRRHASMLKELVSCLDIFTAGDAIDTEGLSALEVRHASAAARRRISEIASSNQVELIHVEGFGLHHLLPRGVSQPIVLGTQNIEYRLDEQRNTLAEAPSMSIATATRYREELAWRSATHCVAVTREDADTIAEIVGRDGVSVVPCGFDHNPVLGVSGDSGEQPNCTFDVVFVGSFAHQPNIDAVLFFCGSILPLIRHTSTLRVGIVGDAPPAEVIDLQRLPGVVVTGRVADVSPYLRSTRVFVCPLRIGGGSKVKVLEALSHGCAIVSTPLGVQGIPSAAAAQVACAATAENFAALVSSQLASAYSPQLVTTQMSTWDDAADRLVAVYQAVLGRVIPKKLD